VYKKIFYIFEGLQNIFDIPSLKMVFRISLININVWSNYTNCTRISFAYKNVLEPLKITNRMLRRVLMKNYYTNQNCSTNDLFSKIIFLKDVYIPKS